MLNKNTITIFTQNLLLQCWYYSNEAYIYTSFNITLMLHALTDHDYNPQYVLSVHSCPVIA